MLGGQPIFGAGSLPELRIGPVTSVVNTLIQATGQLATALKSHGSYSQAVESKVPPKVTSNKNSKKSKKEKKKETKVKNPKSKSSSSEPSTQPTKATQPKKEKKKEVPLNFTADMSRDKRQAAKNLAETAGAGNRSSQEGGAKTPNPVLASSDTNEISQLGTSGTGSETTEREPTLEVMRSRIFSKCKRAYETSKLWGDICDTANITLEQVQKVIFEKDLEQLNHINQVRREGVPPLYAIGVFPELNKINWAVRTDLESKLAQAKHTFDLVSARTAVPEKKSFQDFLNEHKGVNPPLKDPLAFAVGEGGITIPSLRDAMFETFEPFVKNAGIDNLVLSVGGKKEKPFYTVLDGKFRFSDQRLPSVGVRGVLTAAVDSKGVTRVFIYRNLDSLKSESPKLPGKLSDDVPVLLQRMFRKIIAEPPTETVEPKVPVSKETVSTPAKDQRALQRGSSSSTSKNGRGASSRARLQNLTRGGSTSKPTS